MSKCICSFCRKKEGKGGPRRKKGEARGERMHSIASAQEQSKVHSLPFDSISISISALTAVSSPPSIQFTVVFCLPASLSLCWKTSNFISNSWSVVAWSRVHSSECLCFFLLLGILLFPLLFSLSIFSLLHVVLLLTYIKDANERVAQAESDHRVMRGL